MAKLEELKAAYKAAEAAAVYADDVADDAWHAVQAAQVALVAYQEELKKIQEEKQND